MHQTRQSSTTKLPISRKGTKYLARTLSHLSESVPVVIAVRDMLQMADTAKEVRKMIQAGILKINGCPVRDYRESIRLFNIFEAGKSYRLTLLTTGKFTFEESSFKEGRLCKVLDKRLVSRGLFQLNLHDGSNVLTKEKIVPGDSVYLDEKGKIKKHIVLEKGKSVFVIAGKHPGQTGKIMEIENAKIIINHNGDKILVDKGNIVAL